jgi:NADH-quinone oxidoreductase subunit I
MIPKITVDRDRCRTPYQCKRCLQVCPQAVFMVLPREMSTFRENDPEEYDLLPVFKDKCTLCNDCVRVCPLDALAISLEAP